MTGNNHIGTDVQACELEKILRCIGEKCTSCGSCVRQCRFLHLSGTPGKIAVSSSRNGRSDCCNPFECSLCGLCAAVCPEHIDPKTMFLEMRRSAFRSGVGSFRKHKGLSGYERIGTSRLFTWYGLPSRCTTVFFPGCALPGSRPEQTKKVFRLLRDSIPALGIVLDCCTKPSHDLGRQDRFLAMFGEMKRYLTDQGINRVIVACPNCYGIFLEYAPEFFTTSVYEALAGTVAPADPGENGTVTVHDPCQMRYNSTLQDAVRELARRAGLNVEEMTHSRSRTICCGEGGGVPALAPELASSWGDLRVSETAGHALVTSCAACTASLGDRTTTLHILDLVCCPATAISGHAPVSSGLFTCLNRLRLKRYFRANLPVSTSRERTFNPGGKGGGIARLLVTAAIVIASIIVIRSTGIGQYLDQDRLRSFIAGYGALAPAMYIVVYTLAPVLFLPGLPLTIAGGILFGPLWGVVYAITGATAGACAAFLVSRYAARGWIESKISGSRWRKLDDEVARHGWKVVAFTRLIPLFPFNLLNYAFGLTRIRFFDYAVATFLCMLPACIAFIVFSSSLPDLLRGKISGSFILGAALVAAVSSLPFFYRRFSRKTEDGNDDNSDRHT